MVMKMNDDFFSIRLTQLRMSKKVSARNMSLTIGQSESYINKIENGKALPSMHVFYYMCDYLGISPSDFFDNSIKNPIETTELFHNLKNLTPAQMAHISAIIKDMNQ